MLLRDFHGRTCSCLWFGSAVRHPEGALVTALMPFHRWYSRRLLAGAVGLL